MRCFVLCLYVPVLCCAVLCTQARHSDLLEQVQLLEVLRKENGEMAALVAQLQVLKNDQQHLQQLCDQVERLSADNAALQHKSQTLPSLQAEHERLKVRARWACCLVGLTFYRCIVNPLSCSECRSAGAANVASLTKHRFQKVSTKQKVAQTAKPPAAGLVSMLTSLLLVPTVLCMQQASLEGVDALEQHNQELQLQVAKVEQLQAEVNTDSASASLGGPACSRCCALHQPCIAAVVLYLCSHSCSSLAWALVLSWCCLAGRQCCRMLSAPAHAFSCLLLGKTGYPHSSLALLCVQVRLLQDKADELPRIQQEYQEAQSQVEQLQDAVQQVAALRARVAELQAEVRSDRAR